MLKIWFVTLALLFFVGCGTISGEQVNFAQEMCETHGGIKVLDRETMEVTCVDGFNFDYRVPSGWRPETAEDTLEER
jgi:uncharacterized protein YcfL